MPHIWLSPSLCRLYLLFMLVCSVTAVKFDYPAPTSRFFASEQFFDLAYSQHASASTLAVTDCGRHCVSLIDLKTGECFVWRVVLSLRKGGKRRTLVENLMRPSPSALQGQVHQVGGARSALRGICLDSSTQSWICSDLTSIHRIQNGTSNIRI
jgi:hypothetical protein